MVNNGLINTKFSIDIAHIVNNTCTKLEGRVCAHAHRMFIITDACQNVQGPCLAMLLIGISPFARDTELDKYI